MASDHAHQQVYHARGLCHRFRLMIERNSVGESESQVCVAMVGRGKEQAYHSRLTRRGFVVCVIILVEHLIGDRKLIMGVSHLVRFGRGRGASNRSKPDVHKVAVSPLRR